MTVEAGRAVGIETGKNLIKGKVLCHIIQIAFFQPNFHAAFLPSVLFASHVNVGNGIVSASVLFLKDCDIILPYLSAWNAVTDIVAGIKSGAVYMLLI